MLRQDGAPSPAQGDQPAAPGALKAPLFGSLVGKLADEKRWVILDLGSAHSEIIELFSRYRCSLDIADLPTSLETLRQVDEPELLQALADKLIPRRKDEKVDLVLCWDLLNYLEPEAIGTLMATVATRARPGTLVHMLISFSSMHMPAQPCRYGVAGADQLVQYRVTTAQCHAPQYPPKTLEEQLPAFDLERAMLLRNGMQEYLFRVMRPGELARTARTSQKLEYPEEDLVDLKRFV